MLLYPACPTRGGAPAPAGRRTEEGPWDWRSGTFRKPRKAGLGKEAGSTRKLLAPEAVTDITLKGALGLT